MIELQKLSRLVAPFYQLRASPPTTNLPRSNLRDLHHSFRSQEHPFTSKLTSLQANTAEPRQLFIFDPTSLFDPNVVDYRVTGLHLYPQTCMLNAYIALSVSPNSSKFLHLSSDMLACTTCQAMQCIDLTPASVLLWSALS